jgi:fructose-1,6-bisphosphatase II
MAMELVRVTEAAALSAARYMGMGDKELVDKAAVDAMRFALKHIGMDGVIVIGEGEKDQAPMLYIGEKVGDGTGLAVDVAVDPIDGTNLIARGLPGGISAVAISPRGSMNFPRQVVYMNKIVVGKEAKDAIDINASVAANLNSIARAKKLNVQEVTAVVLDRPRHERLLAEIRSAGARVKLISDGDVSASLQAALPNSGVDVLLGIGGTPEGVLSAVAMRCIGGAIQCKAWPRNEEERNAAIAAGVDLDKVYTTEDLVRSDDVFFATTGVSSGDLLKGVRYFTGGAETQSLAMRARSGTIRWISSLHDFDRLQKASFMD